MTPPVKGDRRKHLWIESIVAKNPNDWQRAETDARLIQEFLRSQGVTTSVQRVSNGLIVLSDDGFAPGATADQAAFKRRIVDLGGLYQKAGGRYSFKGCYYPK